MNKKIGSDRNEPPMNMACEDTADDVYVVFP
jgi:hypothetical protein